MAVHLVAQEIKTFVIHKLNKHILRQAGILQYAGFSWYNKHAIIWICLNTKIMKW